MAKPGHMSTAGYDRKMPKLRIYNYEQLITWNRRRLDPADGNVLSPFAADLRNDHEWAVRNDRDMIGHRNCREGFRQFTATRGPKAANLCDPLSHRRHRSLFYGGKLGDM